MNCKNCGGIIRYGARSCEYCGAAVDNIPVRGDRDSQTDDYENEQKPAKRESLDEISERMHCENMERIKQIREQDQQEYGDIGRMISGLSSAGGLRRMTDPLGIRSSMRRAAYRWKRRFVILLFLVIAAIAVYAVISNPVMMSRIKSGIANITGGISESLSDQVTASPDSAE